MGKNTNRFICSQCGYEVSKWIGRCPECGLWNTLLEEKAGNKSKNLSVTKLEALPLSAISTAEVYRLSSGMLEFDRVLGQGIVPGSLILIGGDPGIGKSTLLLQVAHHIANQNHKVLYLSGEESPGQIHIRSQRLSITGQLIYLLNEQNIDILENYIKQIDPGLIIIDSIQTVYSPEISSVPGSIAQLRECTYKLAEMARQFEKPFILVGHVTKEGMLAGPKVLEHMVDVVISFEGEKNYPFRILRGIKNRFGAADEIGLFEMGSRGLTEVRDPSYIFLSATHDNASGIAITASFEGSRALIIEIQALVTPSSLGNSRRMVSGIDQNRLALIIAILEKRTACKLSAYDVYVKITGGVFIKDPAVDMAVAAAIISSYYDRPLNQDTVYIGEISLSGQIRQVPFMDYRLKEVEKMGYKRAVIPDGVRGLNGYTAKMIKIKVIDDLVEATEG